MSTIPGEVTQLLGRLEQGDRAAIAELLPLVYEELRALAVGRLAGERRHHTGVLCVLIPSTLARDRKTQHSQTAFQTSHFFVINLFVSSRRGCF